MSKKYFLNLHLQPLIPLPISLKQSFSICSTLWFLAWVVNVSAQNDASGGPPSKWVVSSILLEGNKRTKPGIIIRELVIQVGDTILSGRLDSLLLQSKRNVFNTALFHSVMFDTVSIGPWLEITITVNERWYTWPNPIFEIADRNFNVWYETRDISRVTYGMFFYQENFRGRNERLAILLKLQYTQQIGFSYSVPYLNKRKKTGLSFSFSNSRWHEVAYSAVNHILLFHRDHNLFMRREWAGGFTFLFRPALYNSHAIGIDYKHNRVHDTIAQLNPEFFKYGRTEQRYVRLGYKFKRDKRDIVNYPLHGHYFDVELVPTFVGFEHKPEVLFWTLASYKKFFEISKRFFYAFALKTKVSAGPSQAYFNIRALGYGNDFVRGYEYYVMDGRHFVLYRSNLKFNLLPTKVFAFEKINLNKFNKIPMALHLNLIGDAGYVWDDRNMPGNYLSNLPVFGYGLGLDFVTYYSVVARFEYSFNSLGERGFFFHMTLPI